MWLTSGLTVEERLHVIQTAGEPEVEGVLGMPLLRATSGSHFRAEELILWMHKASEWVP